MNKTKKRDYTIGGFETVYLSTSIRARNVLNG